MNSLRLLDADSLHVTLAFLGSRAQADVEELADVVKQATVGFGAATLSPRGLAALPPHRPHVLALDLDDEGGRAAAVQSAVSDSLVAAELHEPERRPFRPHVTVARVRRGAKQRSWQLPRLHAEPFVAGEVVLYRSDLRPDGARYVPLARATLAEEGA